MKLFILKVRYFFIVLSYLIKALAQNDIHFSLALVYSACILFNRLYVNYLADNPELIEDTETKGDEALLSAVWQLALDFILVEDLFRNVNEVENNPENIQKVLNLISDFSESLVNSSSAVVERYKEIINGE